MYENDMKYMSAAILEAEKAGPEVYPNPKVGAVIVLNGKIIAREGREGTKKMLSKLKINSYGILIKLPKKKQDLRMDLPTIGLQTLKDIKKHGLKGVVLKSKKNIFLDKTKCINFANKNKIFIKVI